MIKGKQIAPVDLNTLNTLNTLQLVKEKFLEDVYITGDEYDKLVRLLKRKKNIILQGAPGVGKTFVAKRLAKALMGRTSDVADGRIEMIQFHQSYSYEDFIMGYRPNESTGGFKRVNGIFYNFCNLARKDPDKKYFFIIDEINRGNISKIFGETFMLVESDKRSRDYAVKLTYSKKVKNKKQEIVDEPRFFIPPNVHIIGMMNTADRSLAMIDYALRRRFSFIEMQPAFGRKNTSFALEKLANNVSEIKVLIGKIIELNDEIEKTLGKGFKIGHSYFVQEKPLTDEDLKEIVEYEIIPLLEEYWFDDETKLKKWSEYLNGIGECPNESKTSKSKTADSETDDGEEDDQ